MQVTRHHSCRVSPFGHPRIHARLTAPRGISQPPTSFIGSQCQGIHHAPLNTYNTKPKNESPEHSRRNESPRLIRKFALHEMTTHTRTPTPTRKAGPHTSHHLDARNHYPQIKHHTPPPKQGNNTPPTTRSGQGTTGLLSQSPIVCPVIPSTRCFPHRISTSVVHQTPTHYRRGAIHSNRLTIG